MTPNDRQFGIAASKGIGSKGIGTKGISTDGVGLGRGASPEADGRAFGSENSTLSEAPPEGAADAPSPAPDADDGRRRTRVVL